MVVEEDDLGLAAAGQHEGFSDGVGRRCERPIDGVADDHIQGTDAAGLVDRAVFRSAAREEDGEDYDAGAVSSGYAVQGAVAGVEGHGPAADGRVTGADGVIATSVPRYDTRATASTVRTPVGHVAATLD